VHSDYSHNCRILYRFGDIAKYRSKITIFLYPVAFNAPVGGPGRNIAIPFGVEKLEWCGYLTVKKVWWYVSPFRQNTAL